MRFLIGLWKFKWKGVHFTCAGNYHDIAGHQNNRGNSNTEVYSVPLKIDIEK